MAARKRIDSLVFTTLLKKDTNVGVYLFIYVVSHAKTKCLIALRYGRIRHCEKRLPILGSVSMGHRRYRTEEEKSITGGRKYNACIRLN